MDDESPHVPPELTLSCLYTIVPSETPRPGQLGQNHIAVWEVQEIVAGTSGEGSVTLPRPSFYEGKQLQALSGGWGVSCK